MLDVLLTAGWDSVTASESRYVRAELDYWLTDSGKIKSNPSALESIVFKFYCTPKNENPSSEVSHVLMRRG